MVKTRLGVVFGGQSSEHEVSITSAKSIFASLDQEKFLVFPIGIDKEGRWHFFDREDFYQKLANDQMPNFSDLSPYHLIHQKRPEFISFLQSLDCVFPVLHGPNGEDGTIQGFLELFSIPFVGSKALGSSVCMDKDVCKRLLLQEGLQTVNGVVLNSYRNDFRLLLDAKTKDRFCANYQKKREEFLEKKYPVSELNKKKEATVIPIFPLDPIHSKVGYPLDEKGYDAIIETLQFPLFVKPANLGSSVGVEKVTNKESLLSAIKKAFSYDNKVLIEEAIKGRELECSVLGGKIPKASLPGEVIANHEFYSHQAKYFDEKGADFAVPAKLSEEIIHRVQSQAIDAFNALECQGLARVDFFLTDQGGLYINEVNTIPGFTPISLYPQLFEVSGIPFSKLIETLIELAMEKNLSKRLLEDLLDTSSKVTYKANQ